MCPSEECHYARPEVSTLSSDELVALVRERVNGPIGEDISQLLSSENTTGQQFLVIKPDDIDKLSEEDSEVTNALLSIQGSNQRRSPIRYPLPKPRSVHSVFRDMFERAGAASNLRADGRDSSLGSWDFRGNDEDGLELSSSGVLSGSPNDQIRPRKKHFDMGSSEHIEDPCYQELTKEPVIISSPRATHATAEASARPSQASPVFPGTYEESSNDEREESLLRFQDSDVILSTVSSSDPAIHFLNCEETRDEADVRGSPGFSSPVHSSGKPEFEPSLHQYSSGRLDNYTPENAVPTVGMTGMLPSPARLEFTPSERHNTPTKKAHSNADSVDVTSDSCNEITAGIVSVPENAAIFPKAQPATRVKDDVIAGALETLETRNTPPKVKDVGTPSVSSVERGSSVWDEHPAQQSSSPVADPDSSAHEQQDIINSSIPLQSQENDDAIHANPNNSRARQSIVPDEAPVLELSHISEPSLSNILGPMLRAPLTWSRPDSLARTRRTTISIVEPYKPSGQSICRPAGDGDGRTLYPRIGDLPLRKRPNDIGHKSKATSSKRPPKSLARSTVVAQLQAELEQLEAQKTELKRKFDSALQLNRTLRKRIEALERERREERNRQNQSWIYRLWPGGFATDMNKIDNIRLL